MFLAFDISAFSVLLPLALILLLSKLLQLGCKKIKFPQVVGMLACGIIIGILQYTPLNDIILNDSARAGLKFLAEIGVILIMFSAGLGTSIKSIKQSGLTSIIVTILGVIVPMTFGIVVCGLFNGWSGSFEARLPNGVEIVVSRSLSNIFYGVILTATSVSVTVATLKELGRLNGKAGTIILSAAILDDIIGVVILSIILSISGVNSSSNTFGSLICPNAILSVIVDVVTFFVFVIIIGILMHFLFKKLNKRYPHKRRLPIFGLALCFFMAWASEVWFGVADITGAYFAGLALAGIGHHINPQQDALVNDASDYIERKNDVLSYMIFSPVFFANVGINTDFKGITLSMVGFGVCFIIAGLLGKVIGCGIGAKIAKHTFKDSLRVGIGMMARAEVALICCNKGIEAGLVDSRMAPFVVVMIIISSFVTPLVLKATYKNEAPIKEDYTEEVVEP